MKTTARKIAGLLVLLTAGACEASVDPPVDEATPPGAPGATLPRGPDEGGAPTQGPAPASAFSCAPARPGKVGDATLEVKVGDKERTAFVHVPKSYDATKGTTLVLGFHGYGGSAEQMRSQTALDAASDKHGFIVAYAQGTGVSKGFNGGDCCGGAAWNDGADDLAFGRELVKAISKDFCVDPKRVHSAGFSNGGFMSYRFACEASDLFASVASVSGVLGTEPEKCQPKRPVPMLHVHGTADRTVPFEGGGAAAGLGTLAGITFRSVTESIATLRQRYGCTTPPKDTFKNGDTRCQAWAGCKEDSSVQLCVVTEGGHQWPGGESTPLSGKTSTDLVATKAVVDFFLANPMK